ncbi:MAG: TonB family protein [Inquilinaceae bacterium]
MIARHHRPPLVAPRRTWPADRRRRRSLPLIAAAVSVLIHAGVLAAILDPDSPSRNHPVGATIDMVFVPALSAPAPGAAPSAETAKVAVDALKIMTLVQPPATVKPRPAPDRSAAQPAETVPSAPIAATRAVTPPAPPADRTSQPTPASFGSAASATDGASSAPAHVGTTGPRVMAGNAANRPPAYPSAARRRGLEGRVVLTVTVSAAGAVTNIAVRISSGASILDDAAVEAVRAWSFDPGRTGGVAAAGRVDVPIVFRLENG